MATLRLSHLSKVFPNLQVAVDGLDLDVAAGELLVLLGPSGCGKTTTLRLIAGLETPTRGAVLIEGQDVTALPPRHRQVAMVAQESALYPHLDVAGNLAFALRLQRTARAVIQERVADAAAMLGLEPLLTRRVWQLSGGERQRVALARALVRRPRVFLLDEPLSNLDAQLRAQSRLELARLQRELRVTTIYVTHDQEEAIALGHRVAVMHAGRLEQVAAPRTLYDQPANAFVAGFVGTPPMNLLRGRLRCDNGRATWQGVGGALDWPATAPESDDDVLLGFRAEHARIVEAGQGDLAGSVESVHDRGCDAIVHVVLGPTSSPGRAVVHCAAHQMPSLGVSVGLSIDTARLALFHAETGQRMASP